MTTIYNLNVIIDYLIDSGFDESEANHFLRTKKVKNTKTDADGMTVMDLILDNRWALAWHVIREHVEGDIIRPEEDTFVRINGKSYRMN